jgi:hypothetical protein
MIDTPIGMFYIKIIGMQKPCYETIPEELPMSVGSKFVLKCYQPNCRKKVHDATDSSATKCGILT